jgi:tetratricopeptide (TPR) repeat protein
MKAFRCVSRYISLVLLVGSVSVLQAQTSSRGESNTVERGGSGEDSGYSSRTPSSAGERPETNRPSSSRPSRSGGGSGSDDAGVRDLIRSFDMNSSSLNWRGKSFNLGDASVARARFDRYLNIPPATNEDDLEYDKLLETINQRLVGRGGGTVDARINDAWRMLYKAAEYPVDNGLSETLADRIISHRMVAQKLAELQMENRKLEEARALREKHMESIADRDREEFISMTRDPKSQNGNPPPSVEYRSVPHAKRLAEIEKKIEENKAIGLLSSANQRLEFQSMIMQFFAQRRFQHVLMANTFYRYVFGGADNSIEGIDSLKKEIFGGLDVKITTSTIDAVSKEAIADVSESVETVKYLLGQKEVHSAAMRLMEAFYLGEHLPAIKTFPLEEKRRVLTYMRDLDSLATALEVKNFDRADEILGRIKEYAVDFDYGRAGTVIETSKRLSNLAVQRAKSSANLKDLDGAERALEEAILLWPTNPNIAQFSDQILEMTSLKDVAFADFDRLVNQEDYRAIFNDRFRFAAALAMDEERNAQFLNVMKRMEQIETTLAQAQELARIRNPYGAWEVLERTYRLYPEDQLLNRARGDFAVRAAEFASVIARAENAMSAGDYMRAMYAYLEAQKINPTSFFAEEGIRNSVDEILKTRDKRGDTDTKPAPALDQGMEKTVQGG